MATAKPFECLMGAFLCAATFVVGSIAEASCLNSNADTRLRTFCVAEVVEGQTVSFRDAVLFDAMLKREGFSVGIGLPNKIPTNSVNTYVAPILDYNTNINGGNPNRPLVLGNFTFTGDEQNLKREGVVLGLAAGMNGRGIYGKGRYVDYSLSASYAHSPEHRMGMKRSSAGVCSRNLVSNNWYVDACGDTSRLVRDLLAETTSGVSLSTSKLFAFGKSAFHSTSMGIRRHFAEDYTHNQFQLGWSTVRPQGVYTSFNVSLGDAVQNKLATRRTVSATLGTAVFNRALTATAAYSYADGGMLLGFERMDTSRSISINYALTAKISVGMGYKTVNSSIDYFSEKEPTFTIQFAPIRF